MSERQKADGTLVCSVLFMDIVNYSSQSVELQIKWKQQFNGHLVSALQALPESDRLILDTGDGAAICFLCAPEVAVSPALQLLESFLREENELRSGLRVRLGINLGSIRLVKDINGMPNAQGDGINVAQRIMSFAGQNEILVSFSFFDVVSRLSDGYKHLFKLKGVERDKHSREHTVYYLHPPLSANQKDDAEIAVPRGQRSEARPETLPSIAVLPFVNLSSDKENEYFSDGLAEEIINTLTHLPALKVTARTSAFAFRGQNQDLSEIQRRLQVEHVLTGSVRKSGTRIRIAVQLVKMADGFHLWSERYDREISDVFAVQDEIAEAIVAKLKTRLSKGGIASSRRRHSENLEAYNAYLKGRYYWHKLTPGGLAKAKEFYERALALDPEYALVYSALAEYYFAFPTTGLGDAREFIPKARSLAQKALELDDTLADARAMLGAILGIFDYDWKAAEREFAIALNAAPRLPDVQLVYGRWFLLPQRKYEEALAAIEKGRVLDPLVSLFVHWTAEVRFAESRFDLALEICNEALELDSSNWLAHLFIGWSNIYLKKPAEAIVAFSKARALESYSAAIDAGLAACLVKDGREAEAREIFERLSVLRKERYIPTSWFAQMCYHLGDTDAMFSFLNQALEERDPMLFWCTCPRLIDHLRTDPRYLSVVRRMNLDD